MQLWYYKLLALHPKCVWLVVVISSIILMVLSIALKDLPEFTDPALGFETRGTDLASRLTAWGNLIEETRPSGLLTQNPHDIVYKAMLKHKRIHKKSGMRKKKFDPSKVADNSNITAFTNVIDSLAAGKGVLNGTSVGEKTAKRDTEIADKAAEKKSNAKRRRKKVKNGLIAADNYFCDAPSREYSHFVLESRSAIDEMHSNSSLFDFDTINEMCDLELKLANLKNYENFCQLRMVSKTCCRPWSFPNYIAFLSNKSSCTDLEKQDISSVKQILIECHEFYRNGSLKSNCDYSKCINVPAHCMQYDAVYQIFHFLIESTVNVTNLSTIRAMLYLPLAKSTKILPFYYEIKDFTPTGDISIVAMDMGLKNALFDELLIHDSWLIGLGSFSIFVCILVYTNSIIITMSTVFADFSAISIAYFVYQFVFQLPYFPFMNLLAIVIIVGIGADDCFVFMKEWRLAEMEWKQNKIYGSKRESDRMIFLVSSAMSHAAKSIFVTSSTTAMAFFASYFTSITAVRCFGLYAGTLILVNYVLMISWLPVNVVIAEKFKFSICTSESITDFVDRFGQRLHRSIVYLVHKLKYLFIILFLSVGIVSGVIVFYYPKLGLPDTEDFQLFSKHHPFELYDSKYKTLFNFEKSYIETDTFKMPIRFVWGVEAIDDGNYLIPTSKGSLHLENNFTISSEESQNWFLSFCNKLRKQDFYQVQSVSVIRPSCFIENLVDNMNKRCLDPMTNISHAPCCDDQTFPYSANVFDQCLPETISSLYKSPQYIFMPGDSGPKFQHNPAKSNSTPPAVRAIVIEYESSQPFSTSYIEIANFTSHVQNWFDDILKSAPHSLQNGWFISELKFYDLQQTLSLSTINAASIAMGASLIVLLLFTMNWLNSIYAVLTVIFTILTTLGILVLFGWKLNILESISVSTAIGLGMDFVFHYALSYVASDKPDRRSCSNYSLSRMIGPTIMAALTTWLAGFFMLFSSVLAYQQIGMFLIIVMTVSWMYATFFFGSLLCAMGSTIKVIKRNGIERNGMNQLQDVELIQKERGRNVGIHESNRTSEHIED